MIATWYYKLRWEIEKFFGWWKQHLDVYPLIAPSAYGFMVQVLGGLITYLLKTIKRKELWQNAIICQAGGGWRRSRRAAHSMWAVWGKRSKG
jgi:hypothetical protein